MSNKQDRRLLVRSKRRIQSGPAFIAELIVRYAEDSNCFKAEAAAISGYISESKFAEALKVADSLTSLQLYEDPHKFFVANQLAAFVKKVPFKEPLLDPAARALEIFGGAERACRFINRRFLARRRRAALGGKPVPYFKLLNRAREYIRWVLGDEPNLPRIYESCNFGPGASIGVHGDRTHVAAKLSGSWTVSPGALPYVTASFLGDFHVRELLCSQSGYVNLDDELFRGRVEERCVHVEHNKITMVPKNAKVHRTIAIEPTLNSYIQKGIDVEMRRLLLKDSIDLSDQESNQRAAFRGSLGGFNPLVTLDLSAASDSISIQLVKELLPAGWFNLLNRTRSPSYVIDGEIYQYEKFTSMGNGFCFPLETLIFASLVQAVNTETGDKEKYVYGDDIIIRQSGALLLIELLNYCGFKTNVDKTFIVGPFRESCGADYLEGVNVRPYNLDFLPVSDRDIYKIYNGLRASPFVVLPAVLNWILEHIPLGDRFVRMLSGPPDTAAEVTQDVFLSSRHTSYCSGIQGLVWKEWIDRPIADRDAFHPGIQMYGLLRGAPSDGTLPEFAFRRRTRNGIRFVPNAPKR